MKKKLLTLFVLVIITFNISAQECNCLESFDWMIDVFEKNDAGFQYVIDKKGVVDYKKHTEVLKEKAKSALTVNDCHEVMNEWLKYFRPGHIGVYIKKTDILNEDGNGKKSDTEIRLQFKNEKTINFTAKKLISILEKKPNKNPIEGIWSDGNYTIGIISDEKYDKKYTAFIIKADSVYWIPGQVKAEFALNNDDQSYSVDYYLRNHTMQKTQAAFLNDSCTILTLYNNTWIRKYPEVSLSKKDELFLSFSKSTSPFVEKISNKTVYLRIPSFEANKRKDIDSMLEKYNYLITSMPNLIIDIRNGTGGSDASYSKIIPYLYTNPIRYVGIQLYATELNALAFEKYAKEYDDTSRVNHLNRIAARMRNNAGKFISLWEEAYEVDSLDKVLPYPQKVAIVCNHNNGSTDEQFLMTAKQSLKVKVFGRPTGGMLDISNLNEIDFPNGKFMFAYGMSKSYRIPDYCIDGIGIQPDYFIDDAITEYNWIDYTKTILEE
jgi:hypothetical protein